EPQMTGIGGDCFALVKPAGGEQVLALNGSGVAPAAASAAALRDRGMTTVPVASADAVTVPAAMDAFCTMSDTWGRLGLADSLAPVIRYFDEGVPVAPRVAYDWAADADRLQGHGRDWYLSGGAVPRTGDMFRLTGQAEVLRRVARHGRDAFYTGEVADDMLATLCAAGGVHTEADFAAVAATPCDPVGGVYHGSELLEHPPNGQGATAILLLNILSHFDLSAMAPFGAARAHIEAEATKLAYDARNRFLADPDHTTHLAHMLSPETAAQLAALIDPARVLPPVAPPTEAVHKDTIYITVVDGDGMAVSLIYSIFHGFGSGLASEKFGILLQNRGAGFTLTQGHPNELAGGKRPMHTIIPGMVRQQGRVVMPFGVMGGQYQPTGHARLLTNLLDYGLDLQSAVDAPRCFVEGKQLMVERGYGADVCAALADLGHDVAVREGALGGAQAIWMHDSGVLEGASDPRKDGCALGY
ncbi:MAG: gamma-glutamyltransferase family protein, partial [Primorskyibacter sp.]